MQLNAIYSYRIVYPCHANAPGLHFPLMMSLSLKSNSSDTATATAAAVAIVVRAGSC